jgi:hypothetical protein
MEKIENVLKLSEKIKEFDKLLNEINIIRNEYHRNFGKEYGKLKLLCYIISITLPDDLDVSEQIIDIVEQGIKNKRKKIEEELNSFLKL